MADAETARLCTQIVKSQFGPLTGVSDISLIGIYILFSFSNNKFFLPTYTVSCLRSSDSGPPSLGADHPIHSAQAQDGPSRCSRSGPAQSALAHPV